MEKFICAITASILLAACGGGGSGGGGTGSGTKSSQGTVVEKFELSLGSSIVEMSEESSTQVPVAVVGADGVNVTAITSNSNITVTVNDNKNIVIKTLDFQSDETVSITVTGTKGAATKSATFTVKVANTSANKTLENIDWLASNKSAIADFSDETNVFDFSLNVGYKAGTISRSDKVTIASDFANETITSVASIVQAIDVLIEAKSKYQKSEMIESELNVTYIASIAAIDSSVKAIFDVINGVTGKTGMANEIAVRVAKDFIHSKAYSQFSGNTQLGAFQGDAWVFKPAFVFLDALINQTSCEAK